VDLTPAIRDFFAIEDPWLKGYFQMVLAELELSPDSHTNDSLFITQAELLIVGRLVRHYSRGAKQTDMPIEKRRTNPLGSATLKRIEDYVDANLAGEIALRDLANMACMSVGHFLRAFRASSGTTPYHYVLTRRLFRARAMLNTSCLPIAEVAQECGFKTASHLSSKFHASFGASPSQYRALRARSSA
jgi:AraC family transcriptional regulator